MFLGTSGAFLNNSTQKRRERWELSWISLPRERDRVKFLLLSSSQIPSLKNYFGWNSSLMKTAKEKILIPSSLRYPSPSFSFEASKKKKFFFREKRNWNSIIKKKIISLYYNFPSSQIKLVKDFWSQTEEKVGRFVHLAKGARVWNGRGCKY